MSSDTRAALPASAFVFPKDRRYPIHDLAHARNALARVAQRGSDEEKAKVRRTVCRRFPTDDLKKNFLEDLTEQQKYAGYILALLVGSNAARILMERYLGLEVKTLQWLMDPLGELNRAWKAMELKKIKTLIKTRPVSALHMYVMEPKLFAMAENDLTLMRKMEAFEKKFKALSYKDKKAMWTKEYHKITGKKPSSGLFRMMIDEKLFESGAAKRHAKLWREVEMGLPSPKGEKTVQQKPAVKRKPAQQKPVQQKPAVKRKPAPRRLPARRLPARSTMWPPRWPGAPALGALAGAETLGSITNENPNPDGPVLNTRYGNLNMGHATGAVFGAVAPSRAFSAAGAYNFMTDDRYGQSMAQVLEENTGISERTWVAVALSAAALPVAGQAAAFTAGAIPWAAGQLGRAVGVTEGSVYRP